MAIKTSITRFIKCSSRKWMSGWLGLGALLLSGCVTIPPAIQGTTATPQQNLNLIRTSPPVFIGQEARFGGTVISVTNEQHRTRLEIASVPACHWTPVLDLFWENLRKGVLLPM